MKKDKEKDSNLKKNNEKYDIKKKKIKDRKLLKLKNNNSLGIIGAIFGGLVASIPWILIYAYGNIMISALAIIIGFGVFYGYKLFGGKVTKSLPIVLVVISVLICIFTIFISIPIFFIHSKGADINFSTIKYLYEDLNFLQGISIDAIIAIILTIFGAGVIAINIKRRKTRNY